MGQWLCKWPNGDMTLVAASSITEAKDLLDELGDAYDKGVMFIPITGGFFVDFEPVQPSKDEQSKGLKMDFKYSCTDEGTGSLLFDIAEKCPKTRFKELKLVKKGDLNG